MSIEVETRGPHAFCVKLTHSGELYNSPPCKLTKEKTELGATPPHRTLTLPPQVDSLACCNNGASGLVSCVAVRVLSQGVSGTESLGRQVRHIRCSAPPVVCVAGTFVAGK